LNRNKRFELKKKEKYRTKEVRLAKENLVHYQYLLMYQQLVENYHIDIFENHHEKMVEHN
jgi:hypothetical protein